MGYEPPLTRTPSIDALCMEIAEMVGSLGFNSSLSTSPTLHRQLRISTIYSSLLVEGNGLSLDQVTAIIDGKRVLGDRNDILEVENAQRAYALLPDLDPLSLDDLLRAHKVMMDGLVPEAGRFRSRNAGVFDGDRLIHAGSPAKYVPSLMDEFFAWLSSTDLHPLLRSCVFHYEFEFIHPFADGNGRTGRLWHTLMLSQWRAALTWLPVESVILKWQQDYYRAFAESETRGECGPFVTYMLEAIKEALAPYAEVQTSPAAAREKALLSFLADHPTATIAEIAERLGVSRATVDRAAASLRAEGRLRRIGGRRGGHWEVLG